MELTIVTSSRNRLASLKRLEQSILAAEKPFSWEWLSGATYDNPVELREVMTPTLILNWPPTGATKPLNRVFPLARGKYVMLLADDLTVRPETLKNAVAFMDAHPDVGQGALYVETSWKDCHVPPWHGWMYAQFWIVRKDVGDFVGWYDAGCGHYAVDNDLSAKILDAGYGVVAIPGACVVNHDVIDETYHDNTKRSAKDSQQVIEPKWAEHQGRLKQMWDAAYKNISGPYECPIHTKEAVHV